MTMTFLCYAPLAGRRTPWAGPDLHDPYQALGLDIGKATFFMASAMIAAVPIKALPGQVFIPKQQTKGYYSVQKNRL